MLTARQGEVATVTIDLETELQRAPRHDVDLRLPQQSVGIIIVQLSARGILPEVISSPADPVVRCRWVSDDAAYLAYHDQEWGVPVHDDRRLFEFLILEGAQAGLSWLTILRKREHYRAVFDGFDAAAIARYDDSKVASLLADAGIVRNRLKIAATIANARACLTLTEDFGSLDRYLWQFVDGRPIQNQWKTLSDVPAETDQSRAMSRALRKRGFRFVGPTICYAFMQAVGMVNDHTRDCFRHAELGSG